MNESNPFEKKGEKPSSLLNVITILSIIFGVFGILGSLLNFFKAEKNYEDIQQMMHGGDLSELPAFFQNFFNKDTLALAEKSVENKFPLLVIGLLSSALCLYGAIEMQKLKSSGFIIWLTGQFLSVAGLILFIGNVAFVGWAWVGYLPTIILIYLFFTCKKELIKS